MCILLFSLEPTKGRLVPNPPPHTHTQCSPRPAVACMLQSCAHLSGPSYWRSAALDMLDDCSLKLLSLFPENCNSSGFPAYPFSVCCFLFICEHFSAQFFAWPSPQHSLLVSPATWLSDRPPTPRTELLIFSRKHSSLTFSSSSVMAAPSFSSLRPNTLWSSLILLFLTSHPVFQEILLVRPIRIYLGADLISSSVLLSPCHLLSGLFQQLLSCFPPTLHLPGCVLTEKLSDL